MKTDSKYHIFFQDGRDKPRTFTYGNRRKKFTEKDVDRIVRLLPKDHQVIRVIFCDPEEYLEHRRRREAGNSIDEKNELAHSNLNENGNDEIN